MWINRSVGWGGALRKYAIHICLLSVYCSFINTECNIWASAVLRLWVHFSILFCELRWRDGECGIGSAVLRLPPFPFCLPAGVLLFNVQCIIYKNSVFLNSCSMQSAQIDNLTPPPLLWPHPKPLPDWVHDPDWPPGHVPAPPPAHISKTMM